MQGGHDRQNIHQHQRSERWRVMRFVTGANTGMSASGGSSYTQLKEKDGGKEMRSDRIYSDIWGEIIYNELSDLRVNLHDGTNRYHPNLIIPNRLAVEKTIAFLEECLKTNYEIKKKRRVKK